jgi:hypothetical protein
MAIDPSIALGYKGFEAPNPLAQYAQVAQIQNAQNQNAMAQYQLAAAKRTDEQTNVMNELYAKHFNPATGALNQNALNADLIARNQAGQIPVMQAKIADTEHKTYTAQKAKIDAVAEERKFFEGAQRNLATNPSNENVMAWAQDAQISPVLSAETKARAKVEEQKLLAMKPAQRAEYLGAQGSTASDITSRGQLKVSQGQLAVSQGNLKVSQDREARLAQGPIGTTLTPEQNAALYGENGAVAQGKINPKLVNSRNAKMYADAFLLNPNLDPVKLSQNVAVADKALKDFGTGEQGKKVTSFNTAIDHLDTLDKLGAALKNGDIKAFNAIANTLGVQAGQPAATMYNQAARIVGGEVSKAIVPGVGTGKEREETAKAFEAALSPDQLKGADVVAKKLLGGQLNSLELQYKRTTKRDDFADQLLSPAARVAYQSGRPVAAPAAESTKAPTGVDQGLWDHMTPEERKLWK